MGFDGDPVVFKAVSPLSRPAAETGLEGAGFGDGRLFERSWSAGWTVSGAGEDLAGKTVLIVGYGSIGAAIEARLQPFGVTIVRVARSARTEPEVLGIDELHQHLPMADVVVLIVPLTRETHGLIGAAEIGLMKRGALLVNAARGPVVVADALLEALEQHRIRAALDVTDPEPLPAGHPLWSAPNCLITPHVGGSTPEFIHRAFRFGAEQVRRYLAGEELENVVSEVGY